MYPECLPNHALLRQSQPQKYNGLRDSPSHKTGGRVHLSKLPI
jgi:hypothetical protein